MKIVVSAPLPGPSVDQLRGRYDVVVGENDEGLGKTGFIEIARAHGDAEALIPLVSDSIDGEVFDAFPRLRVVANFGVGVDNIDRERARAAGVLVCNTPDVLTDATADLTLALMLAVTRRLLEGERLLRGGQWRGWAPGQLLGTQLSGATLGLVGLGRIGRAVAIRAQAFGMRVVASTRAAVATPDVSADVVDFETLLSVSDIVSLHCPLTPTTRGLFGAETFQKMKPSAVLINTARGAIVDERALARALINGTISGAGIDVYEREPSVTPELLRAPYCVLLPHLGSATRTAREAMARLACENASAVLDGRAPPHPV